MSSFSVWFDRLPFLRSFEFQLNPVAFTVFGKSIAWYGIIICLGMILAYLVSSRKAVRREGFSTDDFLDYILFVIPLGIVGARAFFVWTNPDRYDSFWSMIAIWEGGLAITGGILFGILTIVGVSLVKKKNCLRLLDAAAPGVLVAQAVGRWGNFFNAEVFGVETSLPWAMSLRIGFTEYLNRHPLFLYESLLNLAGFALLMIFYKKKHFHGQHAFFYLVWYGAVRSLLEPLRDADYQLTVDLFGNKVLFSQLFSLAILIIGLAALIAGFFLRRKPIFALAPLPSTETETEPLAEEEPLNESPQEQASCDSLPREDTPSEELSEEPNISTNEKENENDTENS